MKPKLTEHRDVSLMAEFDQALICCLPNLLQISAGFSAYVLNDFGGSAEGIKCEGGNSHLQEEIERKLTYVAHNRNSSDSLPDGRHKSSAH